MTTSMNERTHFFIKIISLTLFSKGLMLVVCDRWVGDGDSLLHIDHSSTSFSSWLGLLNRGSLLAQSPLSAAGSQFGILSPTDSNWDWLNPCVSWLYLCLTSTCFRSSSAYLHRCISWLTVRSRVNMLQSSHSYFSKFLSSCPSPSPSHTHFTNNTQAQQQ